MSGQPPIQRLVAFLNTIRVNAFEFSVNTAAGVYPGLTRWPRALKRRLAHGFAARRRKTGTVALPVLQAGLLYPHLPFVMAALGALYSIPTLWSGLAVDDDLLQREILLSSGFSTAAKGLFTFLDPASNSIRMNLGSLPWWSLAEARVVFFRPLAVLTHWVDYQIWPNSPLLMHVHSILWYSALCVIAALLYRRFLGTGLASGLAAVLFTVNINHFSNVVAINARNSLLAALFGLLALSLHDRWRREGWRPGAWLAALCLALTLLSAEAGLASAAYLAAYTICLDRGSWRQRLASLLPYAAVIFAWRFVYQQLGYGAWGSNFYLDPGREPVRFGKAVLERWPVLMLGQWAMPDPGVYALLSAWARRGYWLLAVLFVLLMGIGLLPLFRKDRKARFWGLGMAMAAMPACAVNPATGRHLIFVGVGAIALLAQLGAGLIDRREDLPSRLAWRVPAWITSLQLLGLQAIVFPILIVSTPAVLGGAYYTAMMDLGPLPGCAQQDVVVVNAPSPGQTIYMLSLRDYRGQPRPVHLRVLAPGHSRVSLTRLDENTLVVRPRYGYLLPPGAPVGNIRDLFPLLHPSYAAQYGDGFYRGSALSMQLGQEITLSGMAGQVTELTADGRPLEMRFRFDRSLDDPSFRWLQWDWRKNAYVPFQPPAVGETVQVDGPF